MIGPVRRPVWGIPGRARKGPVVLILTKTSQAAAVAERASAHLLTRKTHDQPADLQFSVLCRQGSTPLAYHVFVV